MLEDKAKNPPIHERPPTGQGLMSIEFLDGPQNPGNTSKSSTTKPGSLQASRLIAPMKSRQFTPSVRLDIKMNPRLAVHSPVSSVDIVFSGQVRTTKLVSSLNPAEVPALTIKSIPGLLPIEASRCCQKLELMCSAGNDDHHCRRLYSLSV